MIETTEDRLIDALRDVEDPELPISIVDMGLLVDVRQQDSTVDIKITFTAMGCPAMEMIIDDVRTRLLREPGVERVNIEIVWEPIWTSARLSDEGKSALREWGISV